jgi:hypothetical protein
VLFRFCWEHGRRVRAVRPGLPRDRNSLRTCSAAESTCARSAARTCSGAYAHICTAAQILPTTVLQRLREAREVAQRLVTRNGELGDGANVLVRKLEAALHGLREAAVQEPPQSSA